jgi:5-methylcytosine-specific restriction endonuclease McrA
MAEESIVKFCWSCKTSKTRADFPKNRTKPDGLGTECKACRRIRDADYHICNLAKHHARDKGYRETHKEYFREYGRAYYQKNQAKIRACSESRYRNKTPQILAQQKSRRDNNLEQFHEIERRRYWERPEAMRATRRKAYRKNAREHNRKVKIYQQKHPESVRRWKKKWEAANPEARRAVVANNKALRRKAQGRFTASDLLAKYSFHGWRCYLCEIPVTLKTSHPDHRKPISRGGSNWIANIAPACIKCNLRKNNKTESEYRALMTAAI